jgi:hypothetical protein
MEDPNAGLRAVSHWLAASFCMNLTFPDPIPYRSQEKISHNPD